MTDIQWTRSHVTVSARTAAGEPVGPFTAPRLVLTVPLGVLQAPAGNAGAVAVTPMPTAWSGALEHLELGHVTRITLQCRRAPWPDDLGLLHATDAPIAIWWTPLPVRAPIITGWAGGPPSHELNSLDR